jgi:hypothetical protein
VNDPTDNTTRPLAAAVLESRMADHLNPGVRRLVTWLREHGFNTFDSGDGVTHEFANDNAFPYVAITVEPSALIAEADRLERLLASVGIACQPQTQSGDVPTIEAQYSPASCAGAQEHRAIIALVNVTDTTLDAAGMKSEKP